MSDWVGLVSCCSRKLKFPCKAIDMYIGALFKKSILTFRSLGINEIGILSAKYGLVLSNDVIEPSNINRQERMKWVVTTNMQIRRRRSGRKFLCFCGMSYAESLVGLRRIIPFRGLGIGRQLKMFNNGGVYENIVKEKVCI